jgi:hypothetical protein
VRGYGEGNPIAKAWLDRFGWQGLIVFKLAASAIVIGAVLIISRHHPAKAAKIIVFACVVLGLVTWYSSQLIEHPPITEEPTPTISPFRTMGQHRHLPGEVP